MVACPKLACSWEEAILARQTSQLRQAFLRGMSSTTSCIVQIFPRTYVPQRLSKPSGPLRFKWLTRHRQSDQSGERLTGNNLVLSKILAEGIPKRECLAATGADLQQERS